MARIVAQGTPQELKAQTDTESLEEAFLALTGSTIRDETADVGRSDAPDARACGGAAMSAVYVLWLREVRRYPLARADRRRRSASR